MKLKHLFSIAALCICSGANALDITTVEAGTLASQIGDNTTVTTLTVSGPVNALDFEFISGKLTSLTSLDLSKATITPLSGVKAITETSEFKADELPPFALFGTAISSISLPENMVRIGESALGNTAITQIEIPASVISIGNYAFVSCDALTTVTIPSTVTEIGKGIFKDCKSLENATIYSRQTAIPDDMFLNCGNLATVALQPGIKSVGNSSFANCASLDNFSFDTSLVSIGDKAFYASGLGTIDLEQCKALASIGDFAFAKCDRLHTVKLGNGTPALGKGLFFDDSALAYVVLPASTTTIPAFTFKGTNAVKSDNILPDGTREIDDYALYGWDHVTDFQLPDATSHIGSGAMEGWTSLEKLSAETLETVPSLGENVWEGLDPTNTTLIVKNVDMQKQFGAADQWKDFKITIGTTGSDYIIDDVTGGNGHANVDFTVGDGYLKIESKGSEIARVNIFDLTGRTRYTASVDTNTLTVNTSQWRGSVLIADVVLADGSRATLKLSI